MNRRPTLSAILIAANAGLVLASVLCVGFVANRILREQARVDASSRVRLAGVTTLQILDGFGEETATSARLLADRPTLARLLREGNREELAAYLTTFARSSDHSGCAVLEKRAVVAGTAGHPSWDAIASHDPPGAAWIAYREGPDAPLVLVASASVPERSDFEVLVTRVLDPAFEAEVARLVGVPVRIVAADPAAEEFGNTRGGVRAAALATDAPATGYVPSEDAYVAALPLRTRTGSVVGLVETSLSGAEVSAPFKDAARNLFLLSFGVLLVATALGFLLGRRLGMPVDALSDAAERIGRGDLTTPIPHAVGAEVGALATTMEEMRLRLLHLTAELEQRKAEAEAIVTGISEGVFTVDRERRIVYLNPQAATFLGVSASEAVGRFCGDVLNPQGPEGVRPCDTSCPIVHARFRGNARATEHLLLPDGTRRTMVVTSAPPVAARGDEPERRQFQVLRDETDLEATRRLRDTVLANISHEFKTPLSAQLASIELLQDQLRGLPRTEAVQLVSSLERGTLRLTHLIDNLLESVRIDSGRDSIRRAPVALDEVVEEAVELMGSLLAQKGQRIETDLPYPVPTVVGDAQRLVQVFVNLLANAHKFAPAGTTVRIGGARNGSMVSLWVEDEGPGLPPGAGPALFTRFYRAPGEEPEQSGMGLGLWIVKSIVERHGGSVATRAGGTGATIVVTLPVAPVGGGAA